MHRHVVEVGVILNSAHLLIIIGEYPDDSGEVFPALGLALCSAGMEIAGQG